MTTVQEIENQIKKLQERKKEIQLKREIEIGKYLLKKWDVNNLSEKEIFSLIDAQNPKTKSKIESSEKPIPETSSI